MTAEELSKLWFDKWETGDFLNLPISNNFKHTSPYGTIEGKEAYISLVDANKDKFLGHRFEVRDALYTADSSCVRYTAIQGDFRLEVSEWHYCKDGLIEEIVAYYNIEGEISEDRKLKAAGES
ncbi:MAG: nuclear transport factor 2 family protein [Bacteroidota bacterium]